MWNCDCPPDNCALCVRRYLAGEEDGDEAGQRLVDKFLPLVRALARRILACHREMDLRDAEQAVFLRILEKLSLWRDDLPFCRWVGAVAARSLIDQLRAQNTQNRLKARLRDARARTRDFSVFDGPATATLNADSASWFARHRAQVLGGLPAQWVVAYLEVERGRTHESVAQDFHKSVRTIRYWLAAVRDRLLTLSE